MFSNAPVICKEAEQVVVFDGGSLLHLSLREKNFRSTSIVIDEYPDDLTIVGNTYKCSLRRYFKTTGAFLRNTGNKPRVINVTLTEVFKVH